ncbi:MAG: hypothetical protein NVSMB64_13260 [Candidatus Velthaea sp.]
MRFLAREAHDDRIDQRRIVRDGGAGAGVRAHDVKGCLDMALDDPRTKKLDEPRDTQFAEQPVNGREGAKLPRDAC